MRVRVLVFIVQYTKARTIKRRRAEVNGGGGGGAVGAGALNAKCC